MKTRIVTEGRFDQLLIERLLQDLADTYSFVVLSASGINAARPIARKLLIQHREPVVFVFDTDTTDPDGYAEMTRELEGYFNWQSRGTPFLLIPMIPEIEVIFFELPEPLQRHVRQLDESLLVAGRYAPKQVLERVLSEWQSPSGPNDREAFVLSLGSEDLEVLRAHESIGRIRAFLERPALASTG